MELKVKLTINGLEEIEDKLDQIKKLVKEINESSISMNIEYENELETMGKIAEDMRKEA